MRRTTWTDISDKTRKYVLERDKRCIICRSNYNLTLAHVFLSRAKGGRGSKDNLVTLCSKCHYYIMDNPIGKKNNELSKKYKEMCRAYLIAKENINYNDKFLESLRFKKSSDIVS